MTVESLGNPHVAQRTLARGRALVVRSDRALIRVLGDDRGTWLDGLVTQSMTAENLGSGIEALVLSPQGRVEHQLGVVDNGRATFLFCAADRAEDLRAFLDGMIFREDIIVERVPEVVIVGAFAGDASDVLEEDSDVIAHWNDPWGAPASGGYQYASPEHPGEDWTYGEWALSADSWHTRQARLEGVGVGQVPVDAWHALRVAAWRPDITTEGDDTLIPHEVDWLRSAVHLSKGCYRGQETVAKVHNLGAPPRRLVMLHLDGSDDVLPEVGAEVRAEGRPVGRITSSVRHFEEGPIALALVKRATDESLDLDVAAGEAVIRASQQIVVPSSAGHVADVPRLGSLTSRRRQNEQPD